MVFPEETPLEYMESPRVHVKIFIKNARKQTAAATLVSDLFRLQVPTIKYPFFGSPKNTPKNTQNTKTTVPKLP